MAPLTKLLRKLSASRRTNRVFVYSSRKITAKRALYNAVSLPRATGSWFFLMPTRNVNATDCSVCSNRLQMSASARCRVTRRSGICGRSSRVVRRLNIRGGSIWIGGLSIDGVVLPWGPGGFAPFGRVRLFWGGGVGFGEQGEATRL